MWDVIYIWQGERHRHLTQFTSEEAANEAAAEMVRDGWRSWAEEVR